MATATAGSLRPNDITVIGTAVGLLAAAALSGGTYWSGVVGTLSFLGATHSRP